MGVHLRELIPRKEIQLTQLKHKVLMVDAFNLLYQMITTIRQRDGTPLTDNQGNTTSHLVGLFSRATHFMEEGIKLVFVFDGKAPSLKKEERERRASLKEAALAKYQVAKQKENIEDMKKYASRTAFLTPGMVAESQALLEGLGIPIVQAPSEGEAQAAYMVSKGEGYAVVSQDYDSLLFAAPKLIHNLSVAGRRKKTKVSYEKINPEMINLSEVLNTLGITQDQLIVLAILIGTDYNTGGVKGIGPRNGLKLVKEYGTHFDALFKTVSWDAPSSWEEVFETFKKMPVTSDYHLHWKTPDHEKIKKLLVDSHNFSEERVLTTLKKFQTPLQKGLGDFI
ncbi:flap endonuclease-1 [Candidatus Woesearchaeota archaeon]|nr:flap endonuclease-1 [Candidatus Woesearchaeota archaeon]